VHKVAELARIVHELTNGFPLFVRELLDHLMTEGALNFNPGRGRWVWDVEAIRRAELPLSLTSLLGQRLARLSPECTSVLRVAALLGAQVSSREVAAVLECTNEEILRSVMEAMSRKVIQLVEGGAPSGEGGDVKYAFVHDSVRRAIVAEAGHAKEAALHAKIGRRLLCLGRQRAAVYHLNRAPTPAQRVEVVQLVRLNLEAGREAKEMVALDIAYEFLRGGGG
jgi:predicted ATPase